MSKYLAIFDTNKIRNIYDSIVLDKQPSPIIKNITTSFGSIKANYQIICSINDRINVQIAKWNNIDLPGGTSNKYCVTINRALNDEIISQHMQINRCLIVVDGFYIKANWNSNGLFYFADHKSKPLSLGGFYFKLQSKPSIKEIGFSILTWSTTSKYYSLTGDSTIPFIIPKEKISDWLNHKLTFDIKTMESVTHHDLKIFRVLERVFPSKMPELSEV